MSKSTPFLTIGMATAQDYHGCFFTIHAIRMAYPELLDEIEFIVVDNDPNSKHGTTLKKHMKNVANSKYVSMLSPKGTSPSRNRVIEEATGKFTLVMDCHVLLPKDTLTRLFAYLKERETIGVDILQGPLIRDSIQILESHFNDLFRGEMWGIWGKAWRCSCNPDANVFTTMVRDKMSIPLTCTLDPQPVAGCDKCDKPIPTLPQKEYNKAFKEAGFVEAGRDDDSQPFEIPGQGLGMFCVETANWVGFHPDSRAFGGEELYIHEKIRKAGGKAWCLPFLKWLHRFGRPDGVPYVLTRVDKIINYVIEFNELGMDLAPIHKHFVKEGSYPQKQWDRMVKNPLGSRSHQALANEGPKKKSVGKQLQEKDFEEGLHLLNGIDPIYLAIESRKPGPSTHMGVLRRLAVKVDHVTEVTSKRESTVAFLAAKPKKVNTYTMEPRVGLQEKLDGDMDNLELTRIATSHSILRDDDGLPTTDLLYLDSTPDPQHLKFELNTYGVESTRYIVVKNTVKKPALLKTIREFVAAVPEWSVTAQYSEHGGLTVLSRNKEGTEK